MLPFGDITTLDTVTSSTHPSSHNGGGSGGDTNKQQQRHRHQRRQQSTNHDYDYDYDQNQEDHDMNINPTDHDNGVGGGGAGGDNDNTTSERIMLGDSSGAGRDIGAMKAASDHASIPADKFASEDSEHGEKSTPSTSASSTTAKKRTWKKPKDKPKRPLSSYNIYFREYCIPCRSM
jgi:hypothetical protein